MSTNTNASSGGGRNRNKKRKKSSTKKKFDPVSFWGSHESIPTPDGFDTSTPDAVAVINSLGQPPLPGHGAASPHYFKLVYERSTQLAAALAMAGGIEDLTPEEPEEPEETDVGDAPADDLDANQIDDALIEESSDDADPNALVEASDEAE
jgi:hypothetical protein